MASKKRSIKQVTVAATGGGVLGGAIADLLVHVFPYLEGMETPLGIILTALLGLLGGWAVPPKDDAEPLTLDDYHDDTADYSPGAHSAG